MLCRRVGTRHLVAVEDVVQSALLAGLESWAKTGCEGTSLPSARVALRRRPVVRADSNLRHPRHKEFKLEEAVEDAIPIDGRPDGLQPSSPDHLV